MRAQVKVTLWKQTELPENMPIKEAINILNHEEINGFFTIKIMNKYSDFNFDYEEIENTEEDMTIEENNGQATLELRNDNGEIIWSNTKGKI